VGLASEQPIHFGEGKAKLDEMLEAVFSMGSLPRAYKETTLAPVTVGRNITLTLTCRSGYLGCR
jgi:hypothetical protein